MGKVGTSDFVYLAASFVATIYLIHAQRDDNNEWAISVLHRGIRMSRWMRRRLSSVELSLQRGVDALLDARD